MNANTMPPIEGISLPDGTINEGITSTRASTCATPTPKSLEDQGEAE